MISDKKGMPAYKGYEYQIYVTVRTALSHIFKDKNCDFIIIEPATEEDIAANLKVDSDRAISTLKLAFQQPMQIQVKLRNTGPLAVSHFVNIIANKTNNGASKGLPHRKRPVELLNEDPKLMYVLISNSEVNSSLKPFVIRNIGQTSTGNKNNAPKNIHALVEKDKDGFLKRIGILEQQIPRLILLDIKELLTNYCHIPVTKYDACLKELVACVRDRLLGLRDRKWIADNIQETIYKHSGTTLYSKAISSFVRPSNYLKIEKHLKKEDKLIILGPQGVGKTLTADMFEYEYSVCPNPYEIIKKEVGIGGIKKYLKKLGRHLFYLEDPWGINSLSSEATTWISELPKLLEQSNDDKKFLITSRVSILDQAIVSGRSLDTLKDDIISITTENYDKRTRYKILINKMKYLNSWKKDLIMVNKNKIISSLTVPISIDRFVALLKKEDDESKINIEKLLKKSLVESLHATAVEEICNLGDDAISSAIVLWLLVSSGKDISVENLRFIRNAIREKYQRYELDILKLVEWMERATWLSLKGSIYNIHSTTLSGLEEIVEKFSVKAEDIIGNLLESLVEKEKQELAYNIITKLHGRNKVISSEVNTIITNYLTDKLVHSTDDDFKQNFYRLVSWNAGSGPVSLLVNVLNVKEENSEYNMGFQAWEYPDCSEAQFAEIKASGETYQITRNFVRLILPETDTIYNDELIALFHRLEWDFSLECQELLETWVARPIMNTELIIKLALMDKSPSYDIVLNIILNELKNVEKWWSQYVKKYNSAQQAELNFQYINHVIEEPGEHFTPIQNALKIVIAHRRKREGYSRIKNISDHKRLILPWIESIMSSEEPATRKEIKTLVDLCEESHLPKIWEYIAKFKVKNLAYLLINSLLNTGYDNIKDCINALCITLNAKELKEELYKIKDKLSFIRKSYIVMVSKDMKFSEKYNYFDNDRKYIESISTLLNEEELELITYLEKTKENKKIEVDEEYIPYLKEWIDKVPDLYATFAIKVLAESNYDITDIARDFLNRAEEYKARYNVIVFLANNKIKEAHKLILAAVKDEDYHVRELAIKILAESASENDKSAVLNAYKDKSAPVRETCAKIIGDEKWSEGLEILYILLLDTRNVGPCGNTSNFSNNTNYHVARAAASSFNSFSSLPSNVIEKIIEFIKGGKEKSDDIVVHYYLINALTKQDHPELIELFNKFLKNNWYMSGYNNSGFPLRYTAIWGLLFQIDKNSEIVNKLDTPLIENIATHSDERLAAPALILLGLINKTNNKLSLLSEDVLYNNEMTADRVILFLATFLLENVAIPDNFYSESIPENCPGRKVLNYYIQKDNINESSWNDFLKENEDVFKWVEALENKKGINPYLALIINQLFSKKGFRPFKEYNIRENELAENIQEINMYSMMDGR